MNVDLAEKSALVTGASQGIGLAIVRALDGEGARVVAGVRTVTPELADLARGGRVKPVVADLRTVDGAAAPVEEGAAWLGGRLDVLVNNVGRVQLRTGPSSAEVAGGAVGATATGRFTRPEGVAGLVLMLAGARATNVTGTDILIDGGVTTSL